MPTIPRLGQLEITLTNDTIVEGNTVTVELVFAAVEDEAGNNLLGPYGDDGLAAKMTVPITPSILRVNSTNTHIVRGGPVDDNGKPLDSGANASSLIRFSIAGGGAVETDHTITLTWNGQPISELSSANDDTFTFGPSRKSTFWLRADADANTVYNKAVKGALVATIGEVRASDNLTVTTTIPPPRQPEGWEYRDEGTPFTLTRPEHPPSRAPNAWA